ncbi:hypothetical protein FRB99_007634 [Tulasnella sp. 403]|nr:hypothetical protein FRB99_007634 [Tulasnella sp. 403]
MDKPTSSQKKGKGKVKEGDDLTTHHMELVANDTFITKLDSLFTDTKGKGTVWLTHKRYVYDPSGDAVMPSNDDEKEFQCLLRATDGTKKFETLVSPSDLPRFYQAYTTLLKSSMTSLRKRDKKKEKKKAEEAAQRKAKLMTDVVIEGPKRGNGRKKRQRRIKAAIRQEEARKAAPPPSAPPSSANLWSSKEYDLDDEGWQDMPIIRLSDNPLGLDEEDEKKFHYVPPERISEPSAGESHSNATGTVIDYDNRGNEYRAKLEQNESDYTRLRLDDDEEADEAYLRTKYLFDEDKAMTPLSQMQQTKNLLTEAQRVAYVGLCSLAIREMSQGLKRVGSKQLKGSVQAMELWGLKIMGRLYYHMELETAGQLPYLDYLTIVNIGSDYRLTTLPEQKMIESLAEHGVSPMDLVPALLTTHTVRNPEYDPAEAAQKAQRDAEEEAERKLEEETSSEKEKCDEEGDIATEAEPTTPRTPVVPVIPSAREISAKDTLLQPPQSPAQQTTANVLTPNAPLAMPGVSTSLSTTDENVTLDIRWTVLCDLFLLLIADSVYDSRSRVLLENIAAKMGLGWLDVVKFEKRVTDALEIQESIEKIDQKSEVDDRDNAARKRRYAMIGLATIGGGLVIGLSAGLLAPVIGAGLGAAFGTIGISGTTAFLGSAGGAAVITTGGVLTGSGIAAKGMAKRTQQVRTFELLPLHNNKRVNCIITVTGFMSNPQDDVRLPFSVLDPVVGDVFSVLWEPEMMGETGNALKILTAEVLSQVSTTVLQATVMTALMSAIQWPLILTKLGYLIDNPWSNALDRSVAAGGVLADVLMHRNLGVRPITLIGFSLGARVIFYALLELAKHKAYGIVQDVILLGATVTAPTAKWHEVRSVVAGRFVNGYARNDWILNYLFRATTGGFNTVAGLRPVEDVPGLENVDVTDKIAGHMSYRVYMPVILSQLGFPVSATYFDEPEDLDEMIEKEIAREEAKPKKSRFSFWRKSTPVTPTKTVSRPPSSSGGTPSKRPSQDDGLPERMERHSLGTSANATPVRTPSPSHPPPHEGEPGASTTGAGFDFKAIGKVLGKDDLDPAKIRMPHPERPALPRIPSSPLERSESAPIPAPDQDKTPQQTPRLERTSLRETDKDLTLDLAPKVVRSLSTSDEPSSAVATSPQLSYSHSKTSSTPWTSNRWQPPDLDDPPRFGRNGTTGRQSSLSQLPSYAPSTETLAFGGSDGSITFGSGTAPAPVLSFGLADGSISSTNIADPWKVSQPGNNDTGKRPWNSNPWG